MHRTQCFEQGFLNSWFKACIYWARSGSYDDIKKIHALETLSIIVRSIFAKSLAGWEIMEALAGSVNSSDATFTVRMPSHYGMLTGLKLRI
jgi:hypothetical protein